MLGEIYSSTPVSAYQPPQDIADLTSYCKKDFEIGNDILNRPWVELNNLSVTDRDSRDKKTFNAFVDEEIDDPSQSWKWIGTRSRARNKALQMHAQLTAGYIIPMFMAQNEDDEEDRGFSDVMRDGVEWMVENSGYKSSFLQTSMGMLVSPVTYLGAEYAEIYQTIREKTEQGYTKKEILDEVLSGFQAPVYGADQVLILNAYEQNIQRQRGIFKVRWIEYSEAEQRYGEHENWNFVQPGVSTTFDDVSGQFYDIKDDDHPYLVQEVTPMYRSDDTEVCFIGGIYFGDENVEANPIKHRDNKNAPKYDVVPFGYQRISEHFFYYKSLMNSMYWDNLLYDAQSELVMNRALLETEMPVAVSGTDKIDSEIVFPSAVVAFQDKDTKVTPLLPSANFSAAFAAINETKNSMDEASVSDVTGGQMPAANTKATAIAIAERNAKTMLQGVGKTLAESMVQYGALMADIFVNHFTIPQIDELVSDSSKLKYRTFVLKGKNVGGKEVSKTIKFDESLMYNHMSDEQKTEEEIKMAMDAGYPQHKNVLIKVNPEQFARMKYLVRVEPQLMFPKNEEYFQAMLMELQTQLANNPYVSLEALTRKLLYSFFRGEGEDLMQKQPVVPQQEQTKGTAGAMAKNKAIGGAIQGIGMV